MMEETYFSETSVSKPRRLEYEVELTVSSGNHSSWRHTKHSQAYSLPRQARHVFDKK